MTDEYDHPIDALKAVFDGDESRARQVWGALADRGYLVVGRKTRGKWYEQGAEMERRALSDILPRTETISRQYIDDLFDARNPFDRDDAAIKAAMVPYMVGGGSEMDQWWKDEVAPVSVTPQELADRLHEQSYGVGEKHLPIHSCGCSHYAMFLLGVRETHGMYWPDGKGGNAWDPPKAGKRSK